MQALFEIAREKQPSVIFFDEIDALMSVRKVPKIPHYIYAYHCLMYMDVHRILLHILLLCIVWVSCLHYCPMHMYPTGKRA